MEGQNVFGSGSMTGIAITLFIKNPDAEQQGKIYYFDIGNDLKQNEKLEKLNFLKSNDGITVANGWQIITPDLHNDWINLRDDSFSEHIVIGDKFGKESKSLFVNYSSGVKTQRDAWCYNASKVRVENNMMSMISFYNSEVVRFDQAFTGLDNKTKEATVNGFINIAPTHISWTRALKKELVNNRMHEFEPKCLTIGLYRPFTKQWLYFNRRLNEEVLQMPRIFPDLSVNNRVICVSGIGARSGFSAIISSFLPDMQFVDNGQCFPLKLYESTPGSDSPIIGMKPQADLFSDEQTGQTVDVFEQAAEQPCYTVKDGITDAGLAHFRAAYPDENISKEDLFYYIYGLLHSAEYKARYTDNLSKELPRIPCVKTAADFWAFSKAGRELATLHIDYEKQLLYPVKLDCGSKAFASLNPADFYVTKMKFASKADKSTVIYNHAITIKDIPLEAYEYVVNGKPALEWVMERQGVSTHKDSGIVNDANAWAIETMKNARYPLELFQRVITVSIETMKIVKALPVLDI